MWWYFGDYGKGRMPPKVISVNFGLLQDRMVISSVMVEHYGDATSTHPLEEELKLVHW